eukprot:7753699-Alexandrium_andersonii.AAC.1
MATRLCGGTLGTASCRGDGASPAGPRSRRLRPRGACPLSPGAPAFARPGPLWARGRVGHRT